MIHPQPTTALLLLADPDITTPRARPAQLLEARLGHWRGRRLEPRVRVAPKSMGPAHVRCSGTSQTP
jgi:hypothetical protein